MDMKWFVKKTLVLILMMIGLVLFMWVFPYELIRTNLSEMMGL